MKKIVYKNTSRLIVYYLLSEIGNKVLSNNNIIQ
jgi:hypothetical protein